MIFTSAGELFLVGSHDDMYYVNIKKLYIVLKVDLIDPKPFGFDSNEISTETENFTVLGVGV